MCHFSYVQQFTNINHTRAFMIVIKVFLIIFDIKQHFTPKNFKFKKKLKSFFKKCVTFQNFGALGAETVSLFLLGHLLFLEGGYSHCGRTGKKVQHSYRSYSIQNLSYIFLVYMISFSFSLHSQALSSL